MNHLDTTVPLSVVLLHPYHKTEGARVVNHITIRTLITLQPLHNDNRDNRDILFSLFHLKKISRTQGQGKTALQCQYGDRTVMGSDTGMCFLQGGTKEKSERD